MPAVLANGPGVLTTRLVGIRLINFLTTNGLVVVNRYFKIKEKPHADFTVLPRHLH